MNKPLRIAMWSGPRNISTALMRAFENRPDTAVSDEPLYAHYLVATGLDHPGRDAILAAQDSDTAHVIRSLTGPTPDGKPIWYQKHMAQHMLPDASLDWLDVMANCFLIRDPTEVAASFTVQRPDAQAWELGFEQQARLFEHVCEHTGTTPPVLDAADVLKNPRGMLAALCRRLGIAFDTNMLHWPPGPRATDGAWAPHWYAAVERSTGFAPWHPHVATLNKHQRQLADACQPFYERLVGHRLRDIPVGAAAARQAAPPDRH